VPAKKTKLLPNKSKPQNGKPAKDDEPFTVESSLAALDHRDSDDRSFASLKGAVSEATLRAVKEMGFTEMTEIQAKSLTPCSKDAIWWVLPRRAPAKRWPSSFPPLS